MFLKISALTGEKCYMCAYVSRFLFSVHEKFSFKHEALFEVNQGCHEGEKRFVCVCVH